MIFTFSYWDSLHNTLWPRLDYVLKLNIQSVRECDPAKLSNKELGPHYVNIKYFVIKKYAYTSITTITN